MKTLYLSSEHDVGPKRERNRLKRERINLLDAFERKWTQGGNMKGEDMKSSRGHKQGVLSTGAKIRFIKAGLLVAACVGLVACTMESGLGPDALKELQEGQKTILERIGKIEKIQQQLLASGV